MGALDSRLWQQQGKRAQSRQLLTEVYGWCNEGFDTADLQAAKVLLEALSWSSRFTLITMTASFSGRYHISLLKPKMVPL